ncbi:MAG TPA: phenylacetate--CoA ligase family protein, partial [Candidatus Angelobacter sp.]|nr:phenylacetate--CoA ligase family protein [Candidatus Angelobacter sp.]
VRKPEYTEFDSKNLLAALQEKIGDSLTVELAFVEQIPLTQRGKYRFIVQEVDVPAGMGGM